MMHSSGCCDKRVRRNDHLVARTDARGAQREDQRGGAIRDANGMLATQKFGEVLFKLNQIALHNVSAPRHHLGHSLRKLVRPFAVERRIVKNGICLMLSSY